MTLIQSNAVILTLLYTEKCELFRLGRFIGLRPQFFFTIYHYIYQLFSLQKVQRLRKWFLRIFKRVFKLLFWSNNSAKTKDYSFSDKEGLKILTFKKLEPANVGHFRLKID